MKTLAIIILGIILNSNLVANTLNTIPPSETEDPKTEQTITDFDNATERVLEIEKQILDKENQIAVYNSFIRIDRADPAYMVEIQKLKLEIDELNTEMEGLIKI